MSDESKVFYENEVTMPEPAGRLPKMFSALRHHNFRLFWFGQMISLIGTWMQSVSQGWLVLQITNSALLLGLASMAASLPVLIISPIGGVLADNFNKRNVLILTQTLAMLLAFVLAILITTKHIQYWHIIFIAAIAGTALSIDAPTRQAFAVEMVGRKDLLNAIALNSSIFNLARIIGPALAGIIIGAIGVAFCFYLNGISFLAVIAGLLLMRGHFEPANKHQEPLLKHLKEGFNYARKDKRVTSLVTLIACSSIFVMPYAMLMPIFARDILKVGPKGLGILLSAAGAGALIGALSLAALCDLKKKGRLIFIGSIVFIIATILFSFSPNFYLSLLLLLFLGWGMVMQNASINSMLQSLAPDNLRGRVMSLFTLTFMGMMPIGSLQAGIVANYLGAPMALRIGGVIVAVIFYFVVRNNPEVFDLPR